jgi:hypothetical protein
MVNLRRHWAAVRDAAAQIPDEFVYVISLDDPSRGCVGGSIAHVSRDVAARLIVDKTHRLAEKDETSAYLKQEEEKRRGYIRTEERRLRLLPFASPEDSPAPKPKKE